MGFIEKITGLMSAAPEQQKAAETQDTSEETVPETPDRQGQDGEEESKTYTPDEMERLLEDKKKQWLEEMKAEEQERLTHMSEKDRLKQEQLSQEAEIARLQTELNKRDLQTEVFARLEEMKLPASIEKLVQYGDKENTMKSLEKMSGIFSQAVQDGVMMRLRGTTPKGLHHAPAGVRKAMEQYGDTFEQAFSKEINR